MSTNYHYISDSNIKLRKRYVENPKDRYKLICHIHGPGHSSDKFKVLVEFSYKYSKIRLTKEHMQEPATKKKFIR